MDRGRHGEEGGTEPCIIPSPLAGKTPGMIGGWSPPPGPCSIRRPRR
nr:MAG TPA: hypothetical protein [Caudoviricetes sp.]